MEQLKIEEEEEKAAEKLQEDNSMFNGFSLNPKQPAGAKSSKNSSFKPDKTPSSQKGVQSPFGQPPVKKVDKQIPRF